MYESLQNILVHYKIDISLIAVIHALYKNSRASVCINGKLKSWFDIGVHQGCVLSPWLDVLLKK